MANSWLERQFRCLLTVKSRVSKGANHSIKQHHHGLGWMRAFHKPFSCRDRSLTHPIVGMRLDTETGIASFRSLSPAIFSLGLSHWKLFWLCALQEALYKSIDTIRYNTIQYDTIQYDTNTIRYNTIQYNCLNARLETLSGRWVNLV